MLPMWIKGWPAPPGAGPRIFENARFAPALRPLKEDVVGDVGDVLWVLMGTVGIVLLIACANVANLLLVRSAGRQQELAIRAALGAGAGRLARELLIESIVLAVLGGALGLAIAYAALRLLVCRRPRWSAAARRRFACRRSVFAFSFGVSLLSGVLFGLIPVLKRAGPGISKDLRGGGRTLSQSRERHRARNTLVVVQVALALVLLVASGLMIRTFQRAPRGAAGLLAARTDSARPAHDSLDAQVAIRSGSCACSRTSAIVSPRFPGVTALRSPTPRHSSRTHSTTFCTSKGRHTRKARFRRIGASSSSRPDSSGPSACSLVAGRDFSWTDLYDDRPGRGRLGESRARDLARAGAGAGEARSRQQRRSLA